MKKKPSREEVGAIRRAVWEQQNGICIRCPNLITWAGMHLHEKVFRSRGGQVSLENSEGLCADCHIGPRGAHSNRLPRFTKRSEKIGE